MTETMADGRVWLDDRQAAALLKLRRKRIHELRADHSGTFPRARRSATGTLVWSHDELAHWAAAQDRAVSHKKLPAAAAPRREGGPLLRVLLPLLSGAAVLAVSLLMWRRGTYDDLTGADDYLHARNSKALLDSFVNDGAGIVDTWREFGVSSPLLPTLASPLAAGDAAAEDLVLVQLPLVLLLGWVLAVLLRRVGMGPGRWPLAGLLAVSAPVLTWTSTLSFSIVATLGVVASLTAYLASHRLRSRPAAVALGVALGLLSLSRLVAVAYLAALLVPMVVDLLCDREDRQERALNGATTILIAAALAAPWWISTGPDAMDHLLEVGYDDNGGGSLLSTAGERLERTAVETGWLLAIAVLAVFLIGTALAAAHARSQSSRRGRGILVGAGSCVLGMLALSTSANAGAALALPYVVLMAALGVAGVALHLEGRLLPVRSLLALVAVVGLGLGTAATFSSSSPRTWGERPLWLSDTPARAAAEAALGRPGVALPDADRLNQELVARIGTAPVAVLRSDVLVNADGLRYLAALAGDPLPVLPTPDGRLDRSTLEVAQFVVGGRTSSSSAGVEDSKALQAAGFCQVRTDRLSPVNEVVLWAKDGCPKRR